MDLLSDLRLAVGAAFVMTEDADLAPHLIDNRRRFHGRVLCAVRPSSTEEVSRVMQVCAKHGALVFAQGGNTGNSAAATPVVSDLDAARSVMILFDRMSAVESIDTVNDTITVEAGAVVENIRDAAGAQNRLFAVSLAAQGSCTAGGILSTNAGGVHVLHYGNTREQCLGLEVVLADGRILNMMRGLRKDNTGYDLKHLFIGAEGTLGVITCAVMKLHPMPASRTVCVAAFDSIDSVAPLFNALRENTSAPLTAFELMHKGTLDRVARMNPERMAGFTLAGEWYVLAEFTHALLTDEAPQRSELEETFGRLLENETVTDVVVSQSESQALSLWAMREAIPGAFKASGGNVKHDISVTRSLLPQFIVETNRALKDALNWTEPSIFGHFGDGNLHYNIGVCEGFDPQLCFEHEERIHEIVYENVRRFHGSVAAEHGVGRLKRELLESTKSPQEMDVMRAVKRVLDPETRMNPGAVLSPLTEAMQ